MLTSGTAATEANLDSTEAGMAFPVLGISRDGGLFAATNLTMLTRPGAWLLPELKGAELVDSAFRRFQMGHVKVLGPALPRRKDWFGHFKCVAFDLQPLDGTSFQDLKARLIKQVRAKPRDWGEHPDDVGETLRPLAVCSTLTELISVLAPSSNFAGMPRRGLGFPAPPPPSPVDSEPAIGPLLAVSEADLAFPIVGLLRSGKPAAARDLKAFTTVSGYTLRSGALNGLEIVDAHWRRFRVIQVHKTQPRWLQALFRVAELVGYPGWRVDCELAPLTPGSLETTRQLFLAALEADPWRFTQEFNRADHNRERARLRRAETTEALGRGFGASPYECGYSPPALSTVELAAIQARKEKAARENRQALVWLAALYALLSLVGFLALTFPTLGFVWVAAAILWGVAAFLYLVRGCPDWAAIALCPGAVGGVFIGIIGVAGRSS